MTVLEDTYRATGSALASTSCWVVTDGRAGIENQALGLAEAIARKTDLNVTKKVVEIDEPWRSIPYQLWGDPFSRLSRDQSLLRPPFPDIWIGCGRLSVPLTMALKQRAPEVFTVQLQAPRAPAGKFDLIVPPHHDGLSGSNIVSTLGALHRVTDSKLEAEAKRVAPLVAELPTPRVAVLVGGVSKHGKIDDVRARRLVRRLNKLQMSGVGLMITTSRRTPAYLAEQLERLRGLEGVFLWNACGSEKVDNPYFGLLGLADHIIVTADSVNMATEAGYTGKPVHVYYWTKKGLDKKLATFHASLEECGVARQYRGKLPHWSYKRLDETSRLADDVIDRYLTFAGV